MNREQIIKSPGTLEEAVVKFTVNAWHARYRVLSTPEAKWQDTLFGEAPDAIVYAKVRKVSGRNRVEKDSESAKGQEARTRQESTRGMDQLFTEVQPSA